MEEPAKPEEPVKVSEPAKPEAPAPVKTEEKPAPIEEVVAPPPQPTTTPPTARSDATLIESEQLDLIDSELTCSKPASEPQQECDWTWGPPNSRSLDVDHVREDLDPSTEWNKPPRFLHLSGGYHGDGRGTGCLGENSHEGSVLSLSGAASAVVFCYLRTWRGSSGFQSPFGSRPLSYRRASPAPLRSYGDGSRPPEDRGEHSRMGCEERSRWRC